MDDVVDINNEPALSRERHSSSVSFQCAGTFKVNSVIYRRAPVINRTPWRAPRPWPRFLSPSNSVNVIGCLVTRWAGYLGRERCRLKRGGLLLLSLFNYVSITLLSRRSGNHSTRDDGDRVKIYRLQRWPCRRSSTTSWSRIIFDVVNIYTMSSLDDGSFAIGW